MAVSYIGSANSGTSDSSTTAHSLSRFSGTDRLIVSVIYVLDNTTVPDVVSVTRAGTEVFIEATNLRQNFTDPLGKYSKCKVFVYYLLNANYVTAGLEVILCTLNGTADLVTMSSYIFHGAYQGSPGTQKTFTQESASTTAISLDIVDTKLGSLIVYPWLGLENPEVAGSHNASSLVNLTNGASITGISGAITGVFLNTMYGTSATAVTTCGNGWPDLVPLDYIVLAFEVNEFDWVPSTPGISSIGMCEYVSSGQVRKMVDTVTGLDHLEGEAIKVQMDGVLPTDEAGDLVTNSFTVSSGSVTLPKKAAVIHAGLPYEGTIKLLKSNDGSQIGTAQAKMRRVYNAIVRLNRTLGLKVGHDEDNLSPIIFNDDGTLTPTLPLFTGDKEKLPITKWTKEAELVFKQEDPLPCFILAIILESEVEDK